MEPEFGPRALFGTIQELISLFHFLGFKYTSIYISFVTLADHWMIVGQSDGLGNFYGFFVFSICRRFVLEVFLLPERRCHCLAERRRVADSVSQLSQFFSSSVISDMFVNYDARQFPIFVMYNNLM